MELYLAYHQLFSVETMAVYLQILGHVKLTPQPHSSLNTLQLCSIQLYILPQTQMNKQN